MRSACLLQLVDDTGPSAARGSGVVTNALNQRCYPHTGNGGTVGV